MTGKPLCASSCSSHLRASFFSLAVCLLATTHTAIAADAGSDLEDQYLTVVHELKSPSGTGILVTEVDPESPVAASGLRGGDIITEYQGSRVRTLGELRGLVAEVVARRVDDDISSRKVLTRVRRGSQDVLLSLPRAALGIRAIAVESAVAPKLEIRPPDRPGEIELAWNQVLEVLTADNAEGRGGIAPTAFRMLEHLETEAAGKPSRIDENWIGWQSVNLWREGDGIAGSFDIRHVDPGEGNAPPTTERSAVTFRLKHLGDYKTAAALELDAVGSTSLDEKNLWVNATAQRLGETLQVSTILSAQREPAPGAPVSEKATRNAPLDAIPQSAVFVLAAALPQKADTAVGLHLLTLRQFYARPGYVLVTRGKQPLPPDATAPGASSQPALPQRWRVDLMHCGLLVESYWFSDQRRLLAVQSFGVPSIVLRRAANQAEASTPSQAGTRPAPAATRVGNP